MAVAFCANRIKSASDTERRNCVPIMRLKDGVTPAVAQAQLQALDEAIAKEIRSTLMFSAEVRMVPPQSLPRSEYKSKLVDFSESK